jgi:hypothetical protein
VVFFLRVVPHHRRGNARSSTKRATIHATLTNFPNGSNGDGSNGSSPVHVQTAEPEPEPVKVAQEPSSIPVPPFEYVTTAEGLSGVAADLSLEGKIALDIETYDPHVKVSKEGKRKKSGLKKITNRYHSKIRLLQLYRFGAEKVWLIDTKALEKGTALKSEAWEKIKSVLGEREIVGHDITRFDLPWVWEHLRIRASKIIDTLTLNRLITNGLYDPEDPGANLIRWNLSFRRSA